MDAKRSDMVSVRTKFFTPVRGSFPAAVVNNSAQIEMDSVAEVCLSVLLRRWQKGARKSGGPSVNL
jgi:hypothetical protein